MRTLLMSLALAGGDWVIWALALASIAAVAAIYDRYQLLSAEAAALAALRTPLLAALADEDLDTARRTLSSHPGSASRALTETLDALSRGPEAAGEHLAAALSDERRRLEHRLLLLGT